MIDSSKMFSYSICPRHGQAKIAMCKYMPAILLDAMRDAPDTSVALYEGKLCPTFQTLQTLIIEWYLLSLNLNLLS